MGNYENDISKTIENNTEGELMQVGTKVNEVENTNSTAITSSKTSETSELNPLAEPSATGQKNIISVDEASSIASGNNVYINQDNKLMQIDYDTLATAILNKLSTQSFDSLDTSSKLVLGAINELNGKNAFIGIVLNSGDDLNDYKTPGIYRSTSSAITKTLKNIPEIFETGFAMIVFYMANQTNVQVIFSGMNIYMRGSNSFGWQNWYKCNISAILSSI